MSAVFIGVGALAVSAVATGYSIYQQNEARKDTKQANRRAARIEAIKAQRSRVQALRENRIAGAAITNRAAAVGLDGSSGFVGAIGSLDSTAAANQSFVTNVDTLSAQRLGALSRADNAQALAGIGDGVASISRQVGSVALGG